MHLLKAKKSASSSASAWFPVLCTTDSWKESLSLGHGLSQCFLQSALGFLSYLSIETVLWKTANYNCRIRWKLKSACHTGLLAVLIALDHLWHAVSQVPRTPLSPFPCGLLFWLLPECPVHDVAQVLSSPLLSPQVSDAAPKVLLPPPSLLSSGPVYPTAYQVATPNPVSPAPSSPGRLHSASIWCQDLSFQALRSLWPVSSPPLLLRRFWLMLVLLWQGSSLVCPPPGSVAISLPCCSWRLMFLECN